LNSLDLFTHPEMICKQALTYQPGAYAIRKALGRSATIFGNATRDDAVVIIRDFAVLIVPALGRKENGRGRF
jgi:hypothetical protein